MPGQSHWRVDHGLFRVRRTGMSNWDIDTTWYGIPSDAAINLDPENNTEILTSINQVRLSV